MLDKLSSALQCITSGRTPPNKAGDAVMVLQKSLNSIIKTNISTFYSVWTYLFVQAQCSECHCDKYWFIFCETENN